MTEYFLHVWMGLFSSNWVTQEFLGFSRAFWCFRKKRLPVRFVSLNSWGISERTSQAPPTREITGDAFVAARPHASILCQPLDHWDCALLQAAFLCVFAWFCTCRESNRGKIIQVYTNLSQKMCVVATGQNYLLKTWRASKLDKQKGIFWGQEGNDLTLSYVHLPTSFDSLIGFLIQMEAREILITHCSHFVHSAFTVSSLPFSSSSSGGASRIQIMAWLYSPLTCILGSYQCQPNYLCHCNPMWSEALEYYVWACNIAGMRECPCIREPSLLLTYLYISPPVCLKNVN